MASSIHIASPALSSGTPGAFHRFRLARDPENLAAKEKAMFGGGLILVGAIVAIYVCVDFLRPVPRTSPF